MKRNRNKRKRNEKMIRNSKNIKTEKLKTRNKKKFKNKFRARPELNYLNSKKLVGQKVTLTGEGFKPQPLNYRSFARSPVTNLTCEHNQTCSSERTHQFWVRPLLLAPCSGQRDSISVSCASSSCAIGTHRGHPGGVRS